MASRTERNHSGIIRLGDIAWNAVIFPTVATTALSQFAKHGSCAGATPAFQRKLVQAAAVGRFPLSYRFMNAVAGVHGILPDSPEMAYAARTADSMLFVLRSAAQSPAFDVPTFPTDAPIVAMNHATMPSRATPTTTLGRELGGEFSTIGVGGDTIRVMRAERTAIRKAHVRTTPAFKPVEMRASHLDVFASHAGRYPPGLATGRVRPETLDAVVDPSDTLADVANTLIHSTIRTKPMRLIMEFLVGGDPCDNDGVACMHELLCIAVMACQPASGEDVENMCRRAVGQLVKTICSTVGLAKANSRNSLCRVYVAAFRAIADLAGHGAVVRDSVLQHVRDVGATRGPQIRTKSTATQIARIRRMVASIIRTGRSADALGSASAADVDGVAARVATSMLVEHLPTFAWVNAMFGTSGLFETASRILGSLDAHHTRQAVMCVSSAWRAVACLVQTPGSSTERALEWYDDQHTQRVVRQCRWLSRLRASRNCTADWTRVVLVEFPFGANAATTRMQAHPIFVREVWEHLAATAFPREDAGAVVRRLWAATASHARGTTKTRQPLVVSVASFLKMLCGLANDADRDTLLAAFDDEACCLVDAMSSSVVAKRRAASEVVSRLALGIASAKVGSWCVSEDEAPLVWREECARQCVVARQGIADGHKRDRFVRGFHVAILSGIRQVTSAGATVSAHICTATLAMSNWLLQRYHVREDPALSGSDTDIAARPPTCV